MKTKLNTTYHIEKYTHNIVEITSVNGYITTNIVHYTKWNEDDEEILQQFINRLQ